MRDGDGRVLGQQQLRQRLADDVGAADHHRLEARRAKAAPSSPGSMQPSGVQGTSAGRPVGKPAGIDRVEAVDVLGRIDRGDDLLRVDVRGQRQLHQDAVHRRIGVQRARPAPAARPRSRLPAGGDRTSACRCRPPSWSCCRHRPRSPDCCRPARPRARAPGRGRAPAGARRPRPCRAAPPRSPCRR